MKFNTILKEETERWNRTTQRYEKRNFFAALEKRCFLKNSYFLNLFNHMWS